MTGPWPRARATLATTMPWPGQPTSGIPPGTAPAEVSVTQHPKTHPREQGNLRRAAGVYQSPPGHREGCPKPALSPHAAGSRLPQQPRTRRFVPTSLRKKRASCRSPPPRLSLCQWLGDAPADKGLPGAFSQSPWKAPAMPLPSPPPTARLLHPCPAQPLTPQHHPSTPLLSMCLSRIKHQRVWDERSFSSQSSPPRSHHPSPSAKLLERDRATRGQGPD